MNKHTNWSRLAAGALALSLLSGCGAEKAAESKTVTLDPSNPVSLTVWHYYNGAQQSAFDELVSEFNATVGKEKGIYVEGYSQGSVSDLEKAVTAAAAPSALRSFPISSPPMPTQHTPCSSRASWPTFPSFSPLRS